MKLARKALMLIVLAASVAACDEGPTDEGIQVSALAGVYAVQTFEYEADDGSASLDLANIPATQGGPYGITAMEVETDGSFAGTLRLPHEGAVLEFPLTGEITLTGGNGIRVDFNQETIPPGVLDPFEEGTFTLSGNNLTLVLPNVTFDFTMQGNEPVDADLTIVATRS